MLQRLTAESTRWLTRVNRRSKGTQLTGFPIAYTAPGDLPKSLWVEGIDQSAAGNDVELKLTYTKEGKTFEDVIKLTAGVDLDLEAVLDEDEADPGGFVCLNNDDDDVDGVVDYDDGYNKSL